MQSTIVTFYCPHRSAEENAAYALARKSFLATAMQYGLLDLYELVALGLSGTDIGDCVDGAMLVQAIQLDSPDFVRASLDNLEPSAARDSSTWSLVRRAVARLATTHPDGALKRALATDAQLRAELRLHTSAGKGG